METQPGVNLVLINNYHDGLDRLTAGTIDAIAADLWVAAYLIERGGRRGVTIVGKPFATAEGAIAVRKGNFALLNEINRAIDTLKANRTIAKIQDDWRPQEMLFASRQRVRGVVTLTVSALLVILFGAMAMWIITLRKQMHVRRKAESALKTSEERFQLAMRGSMDGLWDRNILTNEVFFSDRYRELLGYAGDEFPGTFASFESRLHPDDKDRVLEMVRAHLERREPYDAEYRLRTKSGEYCWFRERGQAIWDERGAAVRMAGSIRDITARKQAEERINLLQMITMDVAAAKDLPSALEVVMRRVVEKTGWALGQAWVPNQGNTALACCPASFAADAKLDDFRSFSRHATFQPDIGLPGCAWAWRQSVWIRDVALDSSFRRAEGAIRSGLKAGLAVPILSGDHVIAVLEFFLKEPRSEDERLVQVISSVAAQIGLVIERKRAEEALRESENRLRTLTDASFEGIGVCKDGVLMDANEQLLKMLGYTRSEIIGKPVIELVAPESRELVRRMTESGFGEPYEHLAMRKDGTVFPVEVSGRIIASDPHYIRLTAAERPEELSRLMGRSVYDFVPAELHEAMRKRRREALQSGAVGPVFEAPLLRTDGSSIVVEAIAVPFIYTGRPAILNLIRDVSDRKRAETERQQSATREREAREQFTRQLIASQEAERRRIASELHDSLGQDLLLIKNRVQRALGNDSVSTDAREQLEGIRDLASQAIGEVRQISHDLHPYQLDHLGLTRALEAMIESAAQSSGVAFEQKLDSTDDALSTDAATNLYRVVQESLNNILKHSRAKRARIELERDVREIILRIEDNGDGFDVNSVEGAGLGLRNMTERVHILGGTLKVDSQPNRGPRIEVTIPISS